jgi:choline-glycine betaine transporter
MYSVVSTGHHYYYQILFSVFALLLIFLTFSKIGRKKEGLKKLKAEEERGKGLRYQINFLFNFCYQ